MSTARRVAVIGAGAAGMVAAIAVRRNGAHAVLFERNPRPGIKILISGGGRCNITHDGTPSEIEQGFIAREARFLRHALHLFTPDDLLGWLHDQGLATYVRPNGRVFPESGRAEDVLAAFEAIMSLDGVELRCSTQVRDLVIRYGSVRGVVSDNGSEDFDAVIIATGGVSYRKVGTTGDGIRWSAAAGLPVEPLRAALAPIYFDPPPPPHWQGVALRDVVVRVEHNGRPLSLPKGESAVVMWRDDLLLTHRGVSGPAVLEVSRAVARGQELFDGLDLTIDFVPDSTLDDLEQAWSERLATSPRSQVQSFVEQWMPRALVEWFIDGSGLHNGQRLADAPRVGRIALLSRLQRWVPGRIGEIPIDRGEVSAGGIALRAVDPLTMNARDVAGLYIAGEALDIAGAVGGYNLQAAFSTGWVAGCSAAKN